MPIKIVFDGRTRVRVMREVELERAATWWVCKACGACFARPAKAGCHCDDPEIGFPRPYGLPLTEVPADQRKSFEAARRLGGKAAVKALAEAL